MQELGYLNERDSQGNLILPEESTLNPMDAKLKELAGQGYTGFLMTNDVNAAAQALREGKSVQVLGDVNTNRGDGWLKPSATQSSSAAPKAAEFSLDTGFSNLEKAAAEFQKIPSLEEKEKAIVRMQAEVAENTSNAMKKARESAEKELGLAKMRQDLLMSEELDKQHPDYYKYKGIDSNQTAALRRRVQATEALLETKTNALLREDVGLARYMKSADGVVEFARRAITKEREAAGKKDLKEQDMRDFIATLNPDVKEAFAIENPALQDNSGRLDPIKFADHLIGLEKDPTSKKLTMEILTGNVPIEQLYVRGLAGNPVASRLANALQSKRTGLDRGTIEAINADTQRFLTDERYAGDIISARPDILGDADTKKYKGLISRAAAGDKEAGKQALNMRADAANDYAYAKSRAFIENNIARWPTFSDAQGNKIPSVMDDPSAQATLGKLTQENKGKPPSIVQFAAAYLNEPNITPEISMAREQALLQSYGSMLNSINNGIVGSPQTKANIPMELQKLINLNAFYKTQSRQQQNPGNLGWQAGTNTRNLINEFGNTSREVANSMLRPFGLFGRDYVNPAINAFKGE